MGTVYKGYEVVEVLDHTSKNIKQIIENLQNLEQTIKTQIIESIPSNEWSGEHANKIKEVMEGYYLEVIKRYIKYFEEYNNNIEKNIKKQLQVILGDGWEHRNCDLEYAREIVYWKSQDAQKIGDNMHRYENMHNRVRKNILLGESVSRLYGNYWGQRNIEESLSHIKHNGYEFADTFKKIILDQYLHQSEGKMHEIDQIKLNIYEYRNSVNSIVTEYNDFIASGGTIDKFNSQILKYNTEIKRIESILNDKSKSLEERKEALKQFLNEQFGIDIEEERFKSIFTDLSEEQKLKAMIDLYRLTRFNIDPNNDNIQKQIQDNFLNNEYFESWKLKIRSCAYTNTTLIVSNLSPEQYRQLSQNLVYDLEELQTLNSPFILTEYTIKNLNVDEESKYLLRDLLSKGVKKIDLHREEAKGFTSHSKNATFFAMSFKIGNEVIISTAGSQFLSPDNATDFNGSSTFNTFNIDGNPHYYYTAELNKKYQQFYGSGTQINNTGHSLGGGAASFSQNTLGVAGQSVTFDSKGSHNLGNSVNYRGVVSDFQYLNNGHTQYSAGVEGFGIKSHYVKDLKDFKYDDHGFISINNDFESTTIITEDDYQKIKQEEINKIKQKEENNKKTYGS